MSKATGVRIASAISNIVETDAAMEAITGQLVDRVCQPVDLVIFFATPHHSEHFDTIGQHLAKALKPALTLGATAQGVIGMGCEFEQGAGLSVLAANLPNASVYPFGCQQLDDQSVMSQVQSLQNQTNADTKPLQTIILVADPFSTPQQEIVKVFNTAFPDVPLIGGMASAATNPGGNRLMLNDQTRRSGVVGVALSGNINLRSTVSQGCRPIGRPYVITKSKRNIVQELGGRSALDVARELIGDLSAEERQLVSRHALFVGRVINEYQDRFGRGDFLIRNILGVDPESGHIAVADPHVRAGQTLQFQLRDGKTAAEDFMLLLEAQKLHGAAQGALLFSCNGRGTHMFNRPNADAEFVRDALGDIPLVGFFAMGEIGPIGGENFVHGHTACLLVIHEK